MNAIEKKLIELIAQHAEVSPDSLDTTTVIKESGIDSLGVAELIFDIEEAYDISIDMDGDIADRLDLGTIEDMAVLLQKETSKSS